MFDLLLIAFVYLCRVGVYFTCFNFMIVGLPWVLLLVDLGLDSLF